MNRSVMLMSVLLPATVGCYSAPPPEVPASHAPPVVTEVAGEKIRVDVQHEAGTSIVEDKSYTCPQGHTRESPACLVTTHPRRVPVIRTSASATYAGRELTLAELKSLTQPEWKTAWNNAKV